MLQVPAAARAESEGCALGSLLPQLAALPAERLATYVPAPPHTEGDMPASSGTDAAEDGLIFTFPRLGPTEPGGALGDAEDSDGEGYLEGVAPEDH